MLIPMLYEYFEATRDARFMAEMLPVVELELNFWRQNRSRNVALNGREYNVFQYLTPTNTPRPESFREDMTVAQRLRDEERPLFWQVETRNIQRPRKSYVVAEYRDGGRVRLGL